MADSMGRKIGAPDFNPEKYVKELSQRCVGGLELLQQRQKIQTLSEETNAQLKKNVYQNYMQFIETAKEISHLESEMYQLSHMLAEQRALLSTLAETSMLGSRVPTLELDSEPKVAVNAEEEERRKLASIVEKVEGCVSLLEVPDRVLLHDGDLLELDVNENTAMQRVHGYLLSDSLMLATWIPNRRSHVRYKFQAQYQLESLAVVNVRLGSVKNAFKLLAFPDTRLFQCTSDQSKKDWLEAFDKAKKATLSQKQQPREPERSSSIGGVGDSESMNPFDEPPAEPTPESMIPEWLCEAPDDLDVFIAQRHFEEAYYLIIKCQKNWHQLPSCSKLLDIQRKVDTRIRTLTEVMMRELQVSPDRSLQGGLRAARRAVRLLNQLGYSTQACELFLKLSSSILKTQLKRTKREGVSVLYITQLGRIFFNNLMDIAREFLKSFPNSPSCTSAFVVWVGVELQLFTSHLGKHVFLPQSSITTLAECVGAVRKQSEQKGLFVSLMCAQLCELGLDVGYQLDGLLRAPLVRALQDLREKLLDSVKLRAQDDAWRQTNLQNKQGQEKFIQEMKELGFSNISSYAYGDSWVHLTPNTVAFTKLYMILLESALSLALPELEHTVGDTLAQLLRCQLRHVQDCMARSTAGDPAEATAVSRNAAFLMAELLPLAEKNYLAALGHPSPHLQQLHKEFAKLGNATKPITKYSTMGYI